ncbi:hypothetical protein [Capnocytophaga canis]|uniref:hypothetical protein n=1 Tax=Capnocytophaga canis TaxID=1848903 RepID=UPI0015620E7A|nr:hypothetical protein [Capnocytophaga canis]
MTKKEKLKKRKELLKDLDYITLMYSEIKPRAPQVIKYYDKQIQRIVKQLKELGK